jgi:hypothetical protein
VQARIDSADVVVVHGVAMHLTLTLEQVSTPVFLFNVSQNRTCATGAFEGFDEATQDFSNEMMLTEICQQQYLYRPAQFVFQLHCFLCNKSQLRLSGREVIGTPLILRCKFILCD